MMQEPFKTWHLPRRLGGCRAADRDQRLEHGQAYLAARDYLLEKGYGERIERQAGKTPEVLFFPYHARIADAPTIPAYLQDQLDHEINFHEGESPRTPRTDQTRLIFFDVLQNAHFTTVAAYRPTQESPWCYYFFNSFGSPPPQGMFPAGSTVHHWPYQIQQDGISCGYYTAVAMERMAQCFFTNPHLSTEGWVAACTATLTQTYQEGAFDDLRIRLQTIRMTEKAALSPCLLQAHLQRQGLPTRVINLLTQALSQATGLGCTEEAGEARARPDEFSDALLNDLLNNRYRDACLYCLRQPWYQPSAATLEAWEAADKEGINVRPEDFERTPIPALAPTPPPREEPEEDQLPTYLFKGVVHALQAITLCLAVQSLVPLPGLSLVQWSLIALIVAAIGFVMTRRSHSGSNHIMVSASGTALSCFALVVFSIGYQAFGSPLGLTLQSLPLAAGAGAALGLTLIAVVMVTLLTQVSLPFLAGVPPTLGLNPVAADRLSEHRSRQASRSTSIPASLPTPQPWVH